MHDRGRHWHGELRAEHQPVLQPFGEQQQVQLHLQFGIGGVSHADMLHRFSGAREGDIVQAHCAFEGIASWMEKRAAHAPIAALFIDYGHVASAPGDTLEAARGHQPRIVT